MIKISTARDWNDIKQDNYHPPTKQKGQHKWRETDKEKRAKKARIMVSL